MHTGHPATAALSLSFTDLPASLSDAGRSLSPEQMVCDLSASLFLSLLSLASALSLSLSLPLSLRPSSLSLRPFVSLSCSLSLPPSPLPFLSTQRQRNLERVYLCLPTLALYSFFSRLSQKELRQYLDGEIAKLNKASE